MILIKFLTGVILLLLLILVCFAIPYGLKCWLSTPDRTIGENILIGVVCFSWFILIILGIFLFKLVFLCTLA